MTTDQKIDNKLDAFMKQQEQMMVMSEKLDMVIEYTKDVPAIKRSVADLQEHAIRADLTLIDMHRKDDMILERLTALELA